MATLKKEKTSENTSPKGIGGSTEVVYSGYIDHGETDPRLIGAQRYRTFTNMLVNVTIVSVGTRYFLNLIANSDWTFDPVKDSSGEVSEEAQRYADLTKEIMHDMKTPWHRVIKRAAGYRYYGFSLQEWTSKRREDGFIGFADVAPRPQSTIERWNVNKDGDVESVVQRGIVYAEEYTINREYLLYMVDDSLNDSPEGAGLYRDILRTSGELLALEKLEGIGFESDLNGIPIGRAPIAELLAAVANKSMTEAQMAAELKPMKDFLQNRIKNTALSMMMDSTTYQTTDEKGTPSTVKQWDVELLQGYPGTMNEVARAIERKNREIARVLGIEGLLLGSSSQGSNALSQDKSHNLDLIVDSALLEIKASVKKDLVERLWSLNGWPKDLMPNVNTKAAQYRNIEQITSAIKDLAESGAILHPEDPAIDEIRENMGLSKHKKLSPTDIATTQAAIAANKPAGATPNGSE